MTGPRTDKCCGSAASYCLATVAAIGSVDSPQLRVAFTSERSLTDRDATAAHAVISSVLNAYLDVKPFYQAIQDDPVMAELSGKLRGLKKSGDSHSLSGALRFDYRTTDLTQRGARSSTPRDKGVWRRFDRRWGYILRISNSRAMALASVDSLRRCGLSRRKAEYITGIAARIAAQAVDLERLKQYGETQMILDSLCSLRGVGQWTAELTAIRSLID